MSQTPGPPLPVGQQLKERRDQLDLTQGAIANLVGVTVTSVSAAENGRATISRGKRPAWERALDLKPGTISRAYRDGIPIEPATADTHGVYADLTDPHERAVWEMSISEDDRREMIDILRADRKRQRRPA